LLRNKINYLAVGFSSSPFDIHVYNINDGSLVSTLKGHSSFFNDLSQKNESDLMASSSDDRTVRIWNFTTNTLKFILKGHTNGVFSLKQISADLLTSASADSTIKLWKITQGELVKNLEGHTGPIYFSLDSLNNGQHLVSGSGDRTIKVWDLTTGECLQTKQTNSYIYSLAVID
jgi:WD40 repeat protein